MGPWMRWPHLCSCGVQSGCKCTSLSEICFRRSRADWGPLTARRHQVRRLQARRPLARVIDDPAATGPVCTLQIAKFKRFFRMFDSKAVRFSLASWSAIWPLMSFL